MKNQNLLDQFLLVDETIIKKLVEAALVSKNDVVLEIGAGTGMITRKLAQKAGKVLAIEIDKSFKNDLKGLPKNVEVIFDDALDLLKKKLRFNKIVASLPSSMVEPLMWRLVKYNFKIASLLVPLKFAFKLVNNQVFTAYFDFEILEKVSRKSFLPVPKTNWALVRTRRKPEPLKTGEIIRFLKQYVYEHPKAKTNNALAEGWIKFYQAQGKSLTKKQARKLVATKNPLEQKASGG